MTKFMLSAAMATVLAGCCCGRQVVYLYDVKPRVATVALQACVDHAANAQVQVNRESFRMLRFDTNSLLEAEVRQMVGKQAVSDVLDGEGAYWGEKEYRAVSFHCLLNPEGRVVYSFVRPK